MIRAFLNSRWYPDGASLSSHRVDHLFFLMLLVCGIMAIGIFGAMGFFCYKYRYTNKKADRSPIKVNSSTVEWVWSTLLSIFFIIMFVWGARVYYQIYVPPDDSLVVYVVAKQWMWKFYSTDGHNNINELHVPVGKPVKLLMTSNDVIHSLFIPAFRVKQDVLPGRYTSVWFKAEKPGRYRILCTQYCGTDHASMTGWVDAMSPEDFKKWDEIPGQKSAPVFNSMASLSERGRSAFEKHNCSACHAVGEPGARRVAPDLAGLYGRPVILEDGRTVIADDTYIRESILDPNAKIVKGYPPIMPSFAGQIGEDQIIAITSYIKSLGGGQPAPRHTLDTKEARR